MKIRHDAAFISSVLFTVALLSLVPWFWNEASASGFYGYLRPGPTGPLHDVDPRYRDLARTAGQLGGASLTVITIGLVVTWMGYVKRVRWTWFVMFAVVWGWAYPILEMRLLLHNLSWRWISDLVHDAMHDPNPHLPRVLLGALLIFSFMLIALVLPIGAFFKSSKATEKLAAS